MLAARVDKRGPDECWPFLGLKDADGYGRLQIRGRKTERAHRLALELAIGRRLRPDEVCRHVVCDNPPCCNPSHLGAGSIADNNADMLAKGRKAYGERVTSAKLTDPEVLAIRARYAAGETAVSLAKEYGVSDRLIGSIARGEKWPHLGGPRSAPRRQSREATR